jgi:hypothetical protein
MDLEAKVTSPTDGTRAVSYNINHYTCPPSISNGSQIINDFW